MMRRITLLSLTALCFAATAFADVRTEQKSQVKFDGALGRMMNLFGGRTTRDGSVTTVAVKGSRKLTTAGDTAQLVDLGEEKVYDINLKDKSYRVTTFAEIIRQMQDARQKGAAQAAKEPETKKSADSTEPQVEVDFDLKESGQTRTVNGFNAREVVMTVVVREKGKTLDESGGFVTTSNIWLASKVPGIQELADFDRQYAEKLLGPALLDPQQMAAASAMYPMLGPAMDRMQKERVSMDGTAVSTITRFEVVADAATAKAQREQKKEEPAPTGGLSGLGGRLTRRVLDRNKDSADASSAPTDPGRATVMTFTDEILKVTPVVAETEVAIPAGFKEKK